MDVFNISSSFSANNSNHFDNEISAGYSEDSDYTSDLNYPVGQHPNSSASQFLSSAINRSPETSRENSYERDDGVGHHHQYHLSQPQSTNPHHLSPGVHRRQVDEIKIKPYSTIVYFFQRYSPNADDLDYGSMNYDNSREYGDNSLDPEPLSYNSRPRMRNDYTRLVKNYSGI